MQSQFKEENGLLHYVSSIKSGLQAHNNQSPGGKNPPPYFLP